MQAGSLPAAIRDNLLDCYIYRGTSQAEQTNHSARSELPDERAPSVKKAQLDNFIKNFLKKFDILPSEKS